LAVLGEVKAATGRLFAPHWPFQVSHMKHISEAMSTSFLIAVLGFFESSVAAKALGGGEGRFATATGVSANRELVALGVANIIGGCFLALPAFGGYGRSKINASTGGRSPMSSILLSAITLICILFLLRTFYYLPVSFPYLASLINTESNPFYHDISCSLFSPRRSSSRY
jgi:MFS superfamily sulfate permease-like transporter